MGQLDLKEFRWYVADIAESFDKPRAALPGILTELEGIAELKSLFNKLDKDSNGRISSKEWGKAVGQNKEILAKYFGGSSTGEIGQAFSKIDSSGDKQLSWEELVDAAGKFR